MMLHDLVGKTFTRLLVQRKLDQRQNKKIMWECVCVCGAKVVAATGSLNSGNSKSCGCYKAEVTGARNYIHGKTISRVHNSWSAMKQRCYYPAHKDYHSYGGRGITVCDEWRDNFTQFLADMGEPPKGYTLDRIDTNANYTKENCRWATIKQQANNTRRQSAEGRGIYKRKSGIYEVYIRGKYIGSSRVYEEAITIRDSNDGDHYE